MTKLVETAKRPVLVLGGGLGTPRLGPRLNSLIERFGFPVALTWAALDLMAHDHPLRIGPFGVYGQRRATSPSRTPISWSASAPAVAERTGGLLDTFAREADIVMVDAARGELDEFDSRGMDIGLKIEARLDRFVPAWLARLGDAPPRQLADWHQRMSHWRRVLPDVVLRRLPPARAMSTPIILSTSCPTSFPEDELIFVDTGGTSPGHATD